MKGIELPVNVLVIIAVAVLVMLGLVAIYFANPGDVLAKSAATNEACGELQQKGCREGNLNNIPFGYGAYDSLYDYCVDTCKDYVDVDKCCRAIICGGACPGLPKPERK
ncbi:MAG: hypothetical protein ACE5J7_00250 [Candidatus Aenigmatarchaeota archaeon]